jgi:hypothetical protein
MKMLKNKLFIEIIMAVILTPISLLIFALEIMALIKFILN